MRAIEAGATDYLIKPVRRNELATLWQHVWRRSQASAQPPSSTQPDSTALPNQFARVLGSPQQSTSGTDGRSVNHAPMSRLARSSAAAESAQDEPSNEREAASPRPPSDDSGAHEATQVGTPTRHPPQPCIAEPGTPTTLPLGLRELVAIAERHEKEMSKRSQGEDSGDASSFHHSAASSAFTSFATFVPRPCRRGDAHAAQRAEALEAPVAEGKVDPAVRQTQEFVLAFQQAVDEHQQRVTEWARNRKAAIHRFREKRKARTFDKKVRYESRKRLADSRPRIKGQFVKAEVAAALVPNAKK